MSYTSVPEACVCVSWWAYLSIQRISSFAQSYLTGSHPGGALALANHWEFDLHGSSLNLNNLWDPPRVFREFTQNCEHRENEVLALTPLPTSGLPYSIFVNLVLPPNW